MVNSNRQTFWQYYSSKQISDRYKKLLEKNSAQMFRKVENETKKKRKPFSMPDIVSFKFSDKRYCFELPSLILLIRVLCNPCVLALF